MIGSDFEKIHFELLGLNLVEPTAFVTNIIMALVALFILFRISSIKSNLAFYTYWKWFFGLLGFGAIGGAIGHTFYFYFGVAGKLPTWLIGPLAVYCLEQAMISNYPIQNKMHVLKWLTKIKMMLVYSLFFLIYFVVPISDKTTVPFLPIALNTMLGVFLFTGLLAKYYAVNLSNAFRYFYFGVLLTIPIAFIFLLKINLNPWFDKNDLSHVLMTIGIIFFYVGIKKVSQAVPGFKSR
ncbi:MAG: hypothetical protein IPM74_06665 [Crocinitomicaceae bacterium]|nr:hypothetical protein [Crocinitomicaceae bacterium]MBK8925581.1 hypothetical protein [Crocinitomicaceae bacterium]